MIEGVLSKEIKERAEDSSFLNTRIRLNSKYQNINFHRWLHERLNVQPSETILDVGCGTGAQTLKFLEVVGPKGQIVALDICKDSIEQLKQSSHSDPRISAIVGGMDELEKNIQDTPFSGQFTLAHSSYALYYADKPLDVLDFMRRSILPQGRVAVFVPTTPHGLVDIAKQFSDIPKSVFDCLQFGPDVLEPFFRKHFWQVEVHFFISEMKVKAIDDFMSFYQATTYYDAAAEESVFAYAKNEIEKKGEIVYDKNGYLIIGKMKK